ncbi:MAG: archease [Chloroflexi bacterium]|nr:archease [Chloroflexota bacterium]
MKGSFEFLDHTADVGIVAVGENVAEAFSQAATALFTIMVEMENLRETGMREVAVSAPDQEALLVAWLNELLYLSEVDGVLFRRFEVYELTSTDLKARCYGEKVDPARHRLKAEVKSATYHMLHVQQGPPARVQVILDI